MKELLYKEMLLQKAMMKKSVSSILLVIGINVLYSFIGYTGNALCFMMSFFSCFMVLFSAQINSVVLEKKTNAYEKLLTIYDIKKIIHSKILFGAIVSGITGIIFSVVNRIVQIIFFDLEFNIKWQVIEIVFVILESMLFSTLITLLYLAISNATIINYIIMPISMGIGLLLIYLNTITFWQVVAISIGSSIITAILLKLTCLIKRDTLTSE